jgi:hypothetical protein
MQTLAKFTIGVAAIAWLGLAPVMADEVTTSKTTTTTTTADPPAAVVVEHPATDCAHKEVTKTNDDTGTTVHKSETHCD